MKKAWQIFCVCFTLIGNECMSFAHSGRTDKNGCHSGSRPYHCHNGVGASQSNDSSGKEKTIMIILGVVFVATVGIATLVVLASREEATIQFTEANFGSKPETNLFLQLDSNGFKDFGVRFGVQW